VAVRGQDSTGVLFAPGGVAGQIWWGGSLFKIHPWPPTDQHSMQCIRQLGMQGDSRAGLWVS
jgi:hypothetical protein